MASTKYRNVRERDGKFYFRYSVKDGETGKRKQKEDGPYPTAKEAYNAGIKIKAAQLNGVFIETKKVTLNDFGDQWLEMYAASDVKENTVYLRRSMLKGIKERLGGYYMPEITSHMYQIVLNELKAEGLSQSYLKSFHAVMKMIFQKALEMEVISKDITAFVKVPSFTKTVEELEIEDDLPEFLEKEELALFLKTALEHESPQCFRILFVLAYTGMRLGEACSLKDTDIDKLKARISITKTLNIRGSIKDHSLNTPKNKSSIRKIDVSKRVISILNEQVAWRNEFKMNFRKNFDSKSKYIFVDEGRNKGMPLRLATVRDYMHEVLLKAKLPSHLTPHSLRHTYTSLMAEAGVELEAIQANLGHKNDSTTKNIYLHVTESRKRAAVEKLDALMDGLF